MGVTVVTLGREEGGREGGKERREKKGEEEYNSISLEHMNATQLFLVV